VSAVRTLGDSTPSDKDLETTRRYMALLNEQTSLDHLKSVDEMLAQVPTEFQAAVKALAESESFIFTAASGQLERGVKALERDWDLVHAIDRDGHTALHAAAAQGNVDMCDALLKRGANASVQDYEGLCWERGVGVVDFATHSRAHTHTTHSSAGYTPLHWAVENNCVEVVGLLLSSGADPAVKNNAGLTAADKVALLKPKHQGPMLALLETPRRASTAVGSPTAPAPAPPPGGSRVAAPPVPPPGGGGGGGAAGGSGGGAAAAAAGGAGGAGGLVPRRPAGAGPISATLRK